MEAIVKGATVKIRISFTRQVCGTFTEFNSGYKLSIRAIYRETEIDRNMGENKHGTISGSKNRHISLNIENGNDKQHCI